MPLALYPTTNQLCPQVFPHSNLHEEPGIKLLWELLCLFYNSSSHNWLASAWEGHCDGFFNLSHPLHSSLRNHPDRCKTIIGLNHVLNPTLQQILPRCKTVLAQGQYSTGGAPTESCGSWQRSLRHAGRKHPEAIHQHHGSWSISLAKKMRRRTSSKEQDQF